MYVYAQMNIYVYIYMYRHMLLAAMPLCYGLLQALLACHALGSPHVQSACGSPSQENERVLKLGVPKGRCKLKIIVSIFFSIIPTNPYINIPLYNPCITHYSNFHYPYKDHELLKPILCH